LVPVPADPNHKCSKIVVGFLVADKEDGQGHISTIDVLPEHRGKGIATSLIHAAEEDYTKRGFKEMRLEVEVNNRAQTLYFKIGYRVTGVTKKYYDDGSACIRMTKKLETEEALISRMNTPAALEGMSTAFAATPVELGLAAVENAKLP
jgi:GNAT superfamily N-acetyltransferase